VGNMNGMSSVGATFDLAIIVGGFALRALLAGAAFVDLRPRSWICAGPRLLP